MLDRTETPTRDPPRRRGISKFEETRESSAMVSRVACFSRRNCRRRVWRGSVLKDWHATRFDRRPPAARAPATPATTRWPRRPLAFATRRDASRHLVDDDYHASGHSPPKRPKPRLEPPPHRPTDSVGFINSDRPSFIPTAHYLFMASILFIPTLQMPLASTSLPSYHGSVTRHARRMQFLFLNSNRVID